MIKKFKKKPVIIEAIQWTGKNRAEMFAFLNESEHKPHLSHNDTFYIDHFKVEGGLIIKTLEGEHIASIGDYIIKGIKNEFYPCKPDIFEASYEPDNAIANNELKNAIELLHKNNYIVIKITDRMTKDIGECDESNATKDCCGCSCSVCVAQY